MTANIERLHPDLYLLQANLDERINCCTSTPP